MTKKCTKCKIEKKIIEFYKNNTKKDGFSNWCKSCYSIYIKQYRLDNKEKLNKKSRQYNKEHKPEISIRMKGYYQDNREEKLSKAKIYQKEHKEERATYGKQYYQEHKEERDAHTKQYGADHKQEIKLYKDQYRKDNKFKVAKWSKKYKQTDKGKNISIKARHKRRVLKYNGVYEVFNPDEVLKRDDYICQLCGRKTMPDLKNQHLSLYPNLDHIIPLSKGGAHTRENTQCLCHQCNMKKGASVMDNQSRMFG